MEIVDYTRKFTWLTFRRLLLSYDALSIEAAEETMSRLWIMQDGLEQALRDYSDGELEWT